MRKLRLTFFGDNRSTSTSRDTIGGEGASLEERRIRSDELDLIGRIVTPHFSDLIWELGHGAADSAVGIALAQAFRGRTTVHAC